jgi:hypothetical protein
MGLWSERTSVRLLAAFGITAALSVIGCVILLALGVILSFAGMPGYDLP